MARRDKHSRKQARVDPLAKRAMELGIGHQQANDRFEFTDVVNHTDADHREMVRARGYDTEETNDSRRTIRRKTRVELMGEAGIISTEQAAACEYYASNYELGFQTIGCTANYGGAGGGGLGSSDLLARYKAQAEARENFRYARLAIPQYLSGVFDAVVLGTGRPPHMMRKADKTKFSLAAFLLHGQIGHLLTSA